MADINIIELAKLIHSTPERLLEQLIEAGVEVTDVKQSISPDQKRQLLLHLQKTRAAATTTTPAAGTGTAATADTKKRGKITLQRKSVGVVKQGKKSVNVEFRAKRTYTKPIAPAVSEMVPEVASP